VALRFLNVWKPEMHTLRVVSARVKSVSNLGNLQRCVKISDSTAHGQVKSFATAKDNKDKATNAIDLILSALEAAPKNPRQQSQSSSSFLKKSPLKRVEPTLPSIPKEKEIGKLTDYQREELASKKIQQRLIGAYNAKDYVDALQEFMATKVEYGERGHRWKAQGTRLSVLPFGILATKAGYKREFFTKTDTPYLSAFSKLYADVERPESVESEHNKLYDWWDPIHFPYGLVFVPMASEAYRKKLVIINWKEQTLTARELVNDIGDQDKSNGRILSETFFILPPWLTTFKNVQWPATDPFQLDSRLITPEGFAPHKNSSTP